MSIALAVAYNMEEVSSDSSDSPADSNPSQLPTSEFQFPLPEQSSDSSIVPIPDSKALPIPSSESIFPPSESPSDPSISPIPDPNLSHSLSIQGQVEVLLPTDTSRKGVFVVKVSAI